ncbi:hypothetical protein [Nonomuraea sp. NPDC050643]|uniref:hypothetical protein n=1 Tax=Nonomuraea sp. NPDC050643 TaxID=3155660 RepID=UPI0033D85843
MKVSTSRRHMVPRQPIRLQAQGKTVMLLSADKPQVAADIAAAVSIDDYRAATCCPSTSPPPSPNCAPATDRSPWSATTSTTRPRRVALDERSSPLGMNTARPHLSTRQDRRHAHPEDRLALVERFVAAAVLQAAGVGDRLAEAGQDGIQPAQRRVGRHKGATAGPAPPQ